MHRMLRHRKRPRAGGFTLLEVALATVIIGVGVVALLQVISTCTVANTEGVEMTSATSLARNLREYTLNLSFDQVRGLHNHTFDPAIDSRGIAVTSMPGWSQKLEVQAVNPDNLEANVTTTSPTAVRVTAVAIRNGQRVGSVEWYVFK